MNVVGGRVSARGLLGFVLSQSPEFVAPFGSYEPIFGTNPFSIGIPTKVSRAGSSALTNRWICMG